MTLLPKVALSAAVALLIACASGPKTKADAPPPELTGEELHVEQDITTFELTWDGVVQSTTGATVERATWEIVVDGKVVDKGEQQLGVQVPAGQSAPVQVKAHAHYVETAEELKAISERGGSLLAALRGTLVITQDGDEYEVEFSKGREVRTPRMPSVTMHELDAARYSDTEANILFHLGLVNPNPFLLSVSGLNYKVEIAGKQVSEGVRAMGEKVTPAATAVYDIAAPVDEKTVGPEAKALIKSQQIPWVITGELKGDLYAIPFRLDGTVRLNVSK